MGKTRDSGKTEIICDIRMRGTPTEAVSTAVGIV